MSIFMENKYTRWYYSIINNAQARTTLEYSEKHHIIPKSLGGNNDEENLVQLTAREHYVCHLLLTKMTYGMSKRKMLFALWRMVHGNKSQNRHVLNNRQYDYAKRKMVESISSQNTGMLLSEEHKQKLKGKTPWNKGKKGVMSEEAKRKISESRRTSKSSEETKLKIANSLAGKKRSIETRCKMSMAAKNRKNKLVDPLGLEPR